MIFHEQRLEIDSKILSEDIENFFIKACSDNKLELVKYMLTTTSEENYRLINEYINNEKKSDQISTSLFKSIYFYFKQLFSNNEQNNNTQKVYKEDYSQRSLRTEFPCFYLLQLSHHSLIDIFSLNNVEMIECILVNSYNKNNPKVDPIEYLLPKINILSHACSCGHLDVVKFLLTSKDIKTPNIHYKDGEAILSACSNNHLDVVRYLLTSPDLKEHAYVDGYDGVTLSPLQVSFSFKHEDLIIFKYLLTSPELTRHANIHFNEDIVFKECVNINLFNNNSHAALEYLIFDYGIDITDEITNYIHTYCPEVEKLFDNRTLMKNLNQQLHIKLDNNSHNKLSSKNKI